MKKEDLYDESLDTLEEVYKDQGLATSPNATNLKKKILDVVEHVDSLRLQDTGDRKCKVGCTIP